MASVVAGLLWDNLGARGTFVSGALLAGTALLGLVALRGRIGGRYRPAKAPSGW